MFLLKASESNYSPSDNTNPKYSTQKPGADTWYSYWVWHVTHSCSFKISNIWVIIRDNNTLSTWYLSRSITLTILLSIAQYATIKTIADRLKTFDNRQTISLKTEEFMMARRTLSQSSDTSRHIIVDRRGDKSLRTMVWLTVRGERVHTESGRSLGQWSPHYQPGTGVRGVNTPSVRSLRGCCDYKLNYPVVITFNNRGLALTNGQTHHFHQKFKNLPCEIPTISCALFDNFCKIVSFKVNIPWQVMFLLIM